MSVAAAQRLSLADLLLKEGVITRDQHEKALAEYGRTKRSIVRILGDMGVIDENLRMSIIRRNCDCDLVRLQNVAPSSEVGAFVTREVCRRMHAVPLRITDGSVVVAMEDPTDVRTIGDLEKLYQRSVRPVLASSQDIAETIERLPESSESASSFEVVKPSFGYRAVETLCLSLLVFGPMIGFVLFISKTKVGGEWYGSFGLNTFETALLFVVVWGAWASIAYFINDMLWNRRSSV